MSDLEEIYRKLKQIIENNAEDLNKTPEIIGSKAKDKKPSIHLYGKKEVSLFNKKPQPTYIGGIIKQKHYVSFYLSAVYSHPDLISELSPELKKFMKGKSCFNLPRITDELIADIDRALKMGIKKYRELEWI